MRKLVFGVQGRVKTVPAGHTATLIMAGAGDGGLNAAMTTWGRVLQQYQGSMTKLPDPVSTHLGYWTDNGGYYYGGLPLSAKLAYPLFEMLRRAQIPVRYLQLDPFWYPVQSSPCGSGAINWTARPDLYPDGIPALRDQVSGHQIHLSWFRAIISAAVAWS
eukprot:m.30988 g.30988  ORF g.30988 m.30988 type:complete len:161 (+) comp4832_c0_seq2:958-1440(+)